MNKIRIYTEGDFDRETIEFLLSDILGKKDCAEVYPRKEIEDVSGKDNAIKVFIESFNRGEKNAIIVDADNYDRSQILGEIYRLSDFNDIQKAEIDKRLIIAGLVGDEFLKKHLAIEKFMMEDYFIKVILSDEKAYEHLTRKRIFQERNIKYNDCLNNKLIPFIKHLKEQNITISSKKVFDVFRAIVGFYASPATLAEKFLKNMKDKPDLLKDTFRNIIDPLKNIVNMI